MINNTTQFCKNIATDIKSVINRSETNEKAFVRTVSLALRVFGTISAVSFFCETVAFVLNPGVAVPAAIFIVASRAFNMVLSYDVVNIGINMRNVLDTKKDDIYNGTLLKKFYSSFKDEKLAFDFDADPRGEHLGRAVGVGCRIMGTLGMACVALEIVSLPIMPIPLKMKVLTLALYSVTMSAFYDVRKLGENLKKGFDDLNVEKKTLGQGTIFAKYVFKALSALKIGED